MSNDYGQPHVTYNKITGSVVSRGYRRWHVVLRKWHDETGAERFEESTMSWQTEDAAKAAAVTLVEEMRKRVLQSYGS